jgi:UDP-N-acetylmuramate dehydrogenase
LSQTEEHAIKPLLQAPLRNYNTLALPANATALAVVNTDEQLLEALTWARAEKLRAIPLGEGSNVVLAGDIAGLVVRQATPGIRVLEERHDSVLLRVGAGENWHTLVTWTLQHGFYGLENLALIPGSAGAAPIQNIGAYGVELESLLHRVSAVAIEDGKPVELTRHECQFGYRDSIFKHSLRDQLFITSIDLLLSKSSAVNIAYPALSAQLEAAGINRPTPQQVFDAVVSIRSSKLPDPSTQPNAGSFFKNPIVSLVTAQELADRFGAMPQYSQAAAGVKIPAAWMIDHCGWKGQRRGDLGVHSQHALVLVNYGNGDGAGLLSLAAEITESVHDKFAVDLEIEPRVYGAAHG